MTSTWLPTWLALAWATAYAVILALHVVHAVRMPGLARWWHLSHILMAAGMIDMFLPGDLILPAHAWMLLFAAGALAALAVAAVRTSRTHRIPALWSVVAIDLGAMVVMFEMMQRRWLAVSVLLATWFLLEAVGWGSGRLVAVAADELHTTPEAVEAAMAPERDGPAAPTPPAHPVEFPEPDEREGVLATKQHHAVSTVAHGHVLRISLAVMSLGMTYMFLAMQFGMAMAGTMPGSPSGPMSM